MMRVKQILSVVAAAALASNATLPDGTEFPSWEKPLHFSKTYYVDGQAKNGFSLWAVELLDTREMIGVCGVVHVDGTGPDVELVYEFQRSAWGQGYATEAARACLDAALGPLGLRRVIALAYPENAQSIRIMQKLGMRDQGTIDAYGHQLVCLRAHMAWPEPAPWQASQPTLISDHAVANRSVAAS